MFAARRRNSSSHFTCTFNGLTEKNIETWLCQRELQEYHLLCFSCVYHTDLLYEKCQHLKFFFLEYAYCRGSYYYSRYNKYSFIILISAHHFSIPMEELLIFIKLSINTYE